MNLYGEKSGSLPQKVTICVAELGLLALSYSILFGSLSVTIYQFLSFPIPDGNNLRNELNFTFSLITFLRFAFMMFFLMKRKIPLEEVFSVPFAFVLYYVGFSLFTIGSKEPIHATDWLGVILFISGSFINTYAELQRHFWKKRAEHRGKLYTKGLFHYAMHINYFGDVIWVSGYAMLSQNIFSWTIPGFLFCLFVFYNIPKLDFYLKERYGEQYIRYVAKTKKFIPFIY